MLLKYRKLEPIIKTAIPKEKNTLIISFASI